MASADVSEVTSRNTGGKGGGGGEEGSDMYWYLEG